ncbi:DUF6681 family protein [Loigolactobacillus backii]|uniref:Uncharacterized protein n=1 Tax=Loigolactobacillus backii TaxID=375175 RepID=A0A192GXV1_9LACO|nr:DUF6681 family protein [Loigolactobacillus backii]ANK61344.1 hypothetical protein AYR53_00390 [Loigolactobacillus backii]ANK69456.1 hypothetical protein AYR56_04325 [Loigolactobacillus backii]MDA5387438.1 hypothetical protein [Loigolactobacillus backii]MDA5389977.1 hypothetical protein [Loigolactobacillus backii]PIO84049.1 hypothetical protein BSQ39_11015 [Loigolactobacillus backii]
MLSLLDMLNHYLGFFNMNVKLKNRVYTILGILGDIYIGYLAFHFLRLQVWGRGLLFMLLFFVLAYFLTLNVIYYFTTKTAKFDISPKIEKMLGGKAASASDDPMLGSGKANATAGRTRVMPAAGLFNQDKLLPAKVTVDELTQQNINEMVTNLVASGYLSLNYGGLSDEAIYRHAHANPEPFYAIGEATPLPFYEMRQEGDHLYVYAGKNAIDSLNVGEISSIGLMQVQDAQNQYQLVLANAYLTGGPYKVAGRSGVMAGNNPYSVAVQVAYRDKNAPQEKPTRLTQAQTQTQTVTQPTSREPQAPSRRARHQR